MNTDVIKTLESKPAQIRELREMISDMKAQIASLERSFGESADFSKFLAAKTGIACNAITEAVKAEEEETERQAELIIEEHKARLAQIDKEIDSEKDKARRILAGIEAEIESKPVYVKPEVSSWNVKQPEPVPEVRPAPDTIPTPAPAPAPAPIPDPVKISVPAPAREEDGATDDEIELLVRELKERKLRKMSLEAAANEVLKEEEPLPEVKPEETGAVTSDEKVIEGFWEDDEEIMQGALEEVNDLSGEGEVVADTESKHAFILGKFAGDNLFDGSGKLIIAKDEVITEEVVAKAESEGKLVDLIVDMKFS